MIALVLVTAATGMFPNLFDLTQILSST